MRVTVATALALAYATTVLASPMKKLQARQNTGDDDNDDDGVDDDGPRTGNSTTTTNGDDDRDDAVIYSPANLTTVNPGSTFNFTYLCDDDDCTSVRVALIQYIEIATGLPTTAGVGGRYVTAQLTVPANITAGQYVIGVQEIDDDDTDDDDDDGNDDNPYDFDVNFETPDDRDGDERPFLVNVAAAAAA